jgi:hypothetical protein
MLTCVAGHSCVDALAQACKTTNAATPTVRAQIEENGIISPPLFDVSDSLFYPTEKTDQIKIQTVSARRM